MNWATLLMLSGVFVLSGCFQKEAPRSRPLNNAAADQTENPAPAEPVNTAGTLGTTQVEFSSSNVQTQFSDSTGGTAAQTSSDPGDEDDFSENGMPAPTGATSTEVPAEAPMTYNANVNRLLYDARGSEAFIENIKPLIERIRGFRPASADLLQAGFDETGFAVTPINLTKAAELESANLLLPAFKAPGTGEVQLLQLQDHVLLPIEAFKAVPLAANANEQEKIRVRDLRAKQATTLLEAVLFRLSLSTTEQTGGENLVKLAALEHVLAENFMKNRTRINLRLLYEYLNYGKIATTDWQFTELTSIEATSQVMLMAQRKFALTIATPGDAFPRRVQDSTQTVDPVTCELSAEYQGLEKGVKIKLAEPRWPEFEVDLDFDKGPQAYTLKNSMAGNQYVDLELGTKKTDQASFRFSIRYSAAASEDTIGHKPEFIVFEQIPAEGRANKVVVCRLMKQIITPPTGARPSTQNSMGDTDKGARDERSR